MSHNVLLSDGIIKEIFVLLVFVLEIYRQIYQAVLGTAGMNGLNYNSFIGNPLHTNSQIFRMSLFVLSQDEKGSLHIAAEHGREAIVQELIKAGANVNLIDQVSKHLDLENVVCFM